MLLDGGTAGVDLLHYLHGIDKLIVIDAILTDDKPGTVHVVFPEDINLKHSPSPTSPVKGGKISRLPRPLWERDRVRGAIHEIGLIETIKMANQLWGNIETIIIGVVPKDYLDYGTELSVEVSSAIEDVIGILKGLLGIAD